MALLAVLSPAWPLCACCIRFAGAHCRHNPEIPSPPRFPCPMLTAASPRVLPLQVRFATHLALLGMELMTVTPAFARFAGWGHVVSTTAVTCAAAVAVGYSLDLAMRKIFLQQVAQQH